METIFLHIEKKRRNGKTVIVLEGFKHDQTFLEELAGRLKKTCGTGGTLKGCVAEIQGDFRLRNREVLLKDGFQVRG